MFSADVPTAFLQSAPANREIFMVPPEAAGLGPGFLWQVRGAVYGIRGASEVWGLSFRNFLLQDEHWGSKYGITF